MSIIDFLNVYNTNNLNLLRDFIHDNFIHFIENIFDPAKRRLLTVLHPHEVFDYLIFSKVRFHQNFIQLFFETLFDYFDFDTLPSIKMFILNYNTNLGFLLANERILLPQKHEVKIYIFEIFMKNITYRETFLYELRSNDYAYIWNHLIAEDYKSCLYLIDNCVSNINSVDCVLLRDKLEIYNNLLYGKSEKNFNIVDEFYSKVKINIIYILYCCWKKGKYYYIKKLLHKHPYHFELFQELIEDEKDDEKLVIYSTTRLLLKNDRKHVPFSDRVRVLDKFSSVSLKNNGIKLLQKWFSPGGLGGIKAKVEMAESLFN